MKKKSYNFYTTLKQKKEMRIIKINWNKLYDIIAKPRREPSGGPIYVCMSDLLDIV